MKTQFEKSWINARNKWRQIAILDLFGSNPELTVLIFGRLNRTRDRMGLGI